MISQYHCEVCNAYDLYKTNPYLPQPTLPMKGNIFPWDYNFSRLTFSNPGHPTTWGQWGINGRHFPGGGNMAAGKPNVYISAPKGTKIHYKIKLKENSNMLAVSPIHGKKGWNILMAEKDKFIIDGSTLSFLYYDYRLHSHDLQNQKGVCPQKGLTTKSMITTLVDLGFKTNEVKDFSDYWGLRIPNQEYCIYPQTHKTLNRIAHWEVTPSPRFITRILFVLVPKKIVLEKKVKHFTKLPTKKWEPLSSIYRLPATESNKGIEIREWGIAFPIEALDN
jgi:hypothetical protein